MSVVPFDPLTFLARHDLADAQGLTVESLTGGYQNQVYRVRGGRIDWVIKRFNPAPAISLFPNLADAEAMALRRLAACNAAPRSIAFVEHDEDAPVLVYEFYAGQPWSGDVVPVAELLQRIAGVDVQGFRLAPMTAPEILAQGDVFVAECPADLRGRLIGDRPRPMEVEPGPRRLIHTDFGPGNLIDGTEGLKAIDWQCPAAGDPAEDLAAFLSPAFQILYGCAPLTIVEEEAFLEAYGDAQTIRRLRQLRPCFDWRMAAYCAMRQVYWAVIRPEASERYRRSTAALLARLGA